MKFSSQ